MIRTDMSFEDYLKHPAISKSALMQLRQTPAHLRSYLDSQDKPATPSQKLGTAAHVQVLEPDSFSQRFAVGPIDDRRRADWRNFEKALIEENSSLVPITPSEAQAATAIRESIDRRPLIRQLLRMDGPVEASLFWDDLLYCYECKGRADKLVPRLRTIVDLKTGRDLSDRGIQKAIQNYGYHLQAQHYLDGMAAMGEDYDRFVVIWVENSAPYEVRATEFDQGCEWLQLAKVELATLKAEYNRCLEEQNWPGYPDGVMAAPLPPAWIQDLHFTAA